MTGRTADRRGCGKLPEERVFRQRNFRDEAIQQGGFLYESSGFLPGAMNSRGEYALCQIRHQGEFANAGLRRTENGRWEIGQIKGPKNAEPSEGGREHFLQCLEAEAVERILEETNRPIR